MKRVMEPAVRLMNRLRYPQKFALISLLFAIPIAIMTTLWLVELHHRMATTAAERRGLEYVVALGHVLEPLERSRGLRILVDAGDPAARELLDQERANILAAANAVDAVNDRLGARLRVKELWQSLRPRIAHPAVEPGPLIDQVRRLAEQVADQAKLSLDTDLDSYYLMEAVVRRLPALADNLSTVGIGAIEQRLAPAPSAARQSAIVTVLGQAHAERDAVDRGHSVAFREDPTLPARLESTLEGSWRGVESMDAIVSAGGQNAREAYEGYAAAVGAIFRHYDAAASALGDLLRARMHRLAVKRLIILLAVAFTTVVVVYLWIGFYASVKRAVRGLERVTKRMLTGEFSGPVLVEGRDELRQVVDSFNSVAGRLRTEWQRAQDESARARAAEASLAKARDAAEAATRAKSDFLAVMSHEIRTPMNGILGMAHLLLETPLTVQQREYATTVRESGQALAHRAQEKGLDLDTVVPPSVPVALRGDAGRLRQVLLNLLGNAIKFTDHGSVRVEVMRVGESDGRVRLRFEVVDTGPGIPPEGQRRLFQEFTQVDQLATRRAGGTGLGLAICRKIVTAMHGEIGVDSVVGEGSTFWFTVALAPAHGEVKREGATSEPAVGPLRILVAEDNLVNQQVALGLLRRRGHQVDVVGTGRAAVAAVSVQAYDVVLMDVHMPDMDGIEATREIRRLPGEKGRVPIIALSASAMKEETDACMDAGMVGHLPKPIDPVALATLLSRYASAPLPARDAERSGDRSDGIDELYVRLLVDSLGAAKVGQLIAELPQHARPHRERLAGVSAETDLGAVRTAAHALTGMAANLGLTALAELTSAIEDACRAGRAEEAVSLCRRLDASFEGAVQRLEALCPDSSNAS
jgi:signal transduction histidine kinase/FixJ family two-component response regulator/HPt (histidine-containing phosphotransfer) domain-containing protein